MENNGKVLCEAKISAKLHIIAKLILWIIVLILIFIGFNCFFEYESLSGGKVLEEKCFWGICIYYDAYQELDNYQHLYRSYIPSGIIITIIINLILLALPLIIEKIIKFIAKRCRLTLTEKQICGQLKTLFGKKQIQMPIEKLDNIMIKNSFMDKMRSGETILVSSNSGKIYFHYVQNAEEFVQEALKCIEAVKEKNAKSTTAPVQSISNDATEKIAALKQMLEQKLISQEEFDVKKEEILSKM